MEVDIDIDKVSESPENDSTTASDIPAAERVVEAEPTDNQEDVVEFIFSETQKTPNEKIKNL